MYTVRTASEKPAATKTLNVQLPEKLYWHLRECATQSRMSLKDYVAEVARTATPASGPTSPEGVDGGETESSCPTN